MSWHKSKRKWTAKIHGRKNCNLGSFSDQAAAARAYDAAARKLQGQHAILNFSDDDYDDMDEQRDESDGRGK